MGIADEASQLPVSGRTSAGDHAALLKAESWFRALSANAADFWTDAVEEFPDSFLQDAVSVGFELDAPETTKYFYFFHRDGAITNPPSDGPFGARGTRSPELTSADFISIFRYRSAPDDADVRRAFVSRYAELRITYSDWLLNRHN